MVDHAHTSSAGLPPRFNSVLHTPRRGGQVGTGTKIRIRHGRRTRQGKNERTDSSAFACTPFQMNSKSREGEGLALHAQQQRPFRPPRPNLEQTRCARPHSSTTPRRPVSLNLTHPQVELLSPDLGGGAQQLSLQGRLCLPSRSPTVRGKGARNGHCGGAVLGGRFHWHDSRRVRPARGVDGGGCGRRLQPMGIAPPSSTRCGAATGRRRGPAGRPAAGRRPRPGS